MVFRNNLCFKFFKDKTLKVCAVCGPGVKKCLHFSNESVSSGDSSTDFLQWELSLDYVSVVFPLVFTI